MAAPQATAQEITEENGYLGSLELGESKRAVQVDTAVAVTIVDQSEIEDRQASTVAELIDSVPGVTLVNGGTAAGSGINIRGYGANASYGTDQKVAIIVDGATKGSEELYRIGTQLYTDPMLYRQVEVIRGTVGSFEYGTGIVGGVVKFETKDASEFTYGEIGFKLRETLEFVSNGNGFTSSTILAWQPSENAEYLFNYTRRQLGVQTDGDGNEINPASGGIDDPSYLVKGKFSFGESNDQSVTLSYSDTNSDQQDVPYDSLSNLDFGNVDRETHNITAILAYNYNPVGNDLIDLTALLTYSDEQIDSTSLEPYSPFLSPLLDADQRYETTTLSLKNTSLFQTGNAEHNLRSGIEFIRRERLDAYSAPGGVDNRVAVFMVDDIQYGDHLTYTPALRYETSTTDSNDSSVIASYQNDALVGGLSVRYAFDSGFAVFASGAYTEGLPILDDLENPLYMTQSEKARTYEVGASYVRGDAFFGGDSLALKANLYVTSLWDVTSYTDIGQIDTEGLELEGSYTHQSGVYVDMNANIVNGEQIALDGTSERWSRLAADSVGITVGKRFDEKLDVSWELVAAASVDDVDDPTPGYGVNNLRATYRPQDGILEGTEVRFGLENVFDKEYRTHLSTRNAAGRNFKLTLAKTF
ncbi:TonB-dependent receptor domain-containing protein [Falsihalocynthiibacter arcticus]|uniref:Ligand-gated channel n=1 Tax=Falsihalocynthiibacter arcticus TaxID=1579316 RepID=A0A126V5P9_9RHOB|nr:TonB-dependent receptor [Falsihalocynthiibacter arcticus]AML53638.1 ligand-gated channel [Falsihalocynthiibacter arcticus]